MLHSILAARPSLIAPIGIGVCLALTTFTACDGTNLATLDGGDGDAGQSPTDGGGGRTDGGAPEAPTPESPTPDAPSPDAPSPDAPSPDAPLPDAGTVDGGSDAGTSTPDAGIEPTDAGGGPADGGPTGDAGPATYAGCFADITGDDLSGPDYDQFGPVIDADCTGTNHQTITDIERVVFLGDSVTVGTPPTQSADFFRSRLAADLATRFGIEAPNNTWRIANPLSGMPAVQDSGAFSACAEWGARNDDLLQDGTQVVDCLPESERDKRTLVVLTMGGNDVANMTRRGTNPTVTEADLYLQVQTFVQLLDDTLAWLNEPGRFPNGVFVVFANLYEYTDGTGDILSCPAASTAGFDEPWEDQALLDSLIVYANEQYMRVAVDYQADMIFMLERFCGHGFRNDDVDGRCYRGPDAERWFDLTCIHPTPRGHQEIADMFLDVIE